MIIKSKEKLLDLSCPVIMGILNVTPDSFYDGGFYDNEKKVLSQVKKMIDQGARIIDVGGYSSRPGADDITTNLELERVLPIVKLIKENFSEVLISIDTFRSEVAKQCVKNGADIVNDISGGSLDSKMFETVADLGVPYVMMHMRGNPGNMMDKTDYENVVNEIEEYFKEKIESAESFGINDIIIDPGFGFSKTTKQNFDILNNLNFLNKLDRPLLIGVSRKSMIYKTLGISPIDSLNGSTVLHTISLLNGAKIIRTHDVKEARECIRLVNELKS
jgi:dihydropteroate synthase|tara:strand:- start:491 stop:1315 length:825 start_codon:yes stop_codon:yes gene_type:complete